MNKKNGFGTFWLIGIMIMGLFAVLGSLPVAALGEEANGLAEDVYVFDLKNKEIIRESSGTGGGERLAEILPWAKGPVEATFRWYEKEYQEVLTKRYGEYFLPTNSETLVLMNEWLESIGEEPFLGQRPYSLSDLKAIFDERGYYCALEGQLIHTSKDMDGDAWTPNACFDLVKEVRLGKLSDLFYDGVNYIDYINRNVEFVFKDLDYFLGSKQEEVFFVGLVEGIVINGKVSLGGDDQLMIDMARASDSDLKALLALRPFSGFPNDYPYFMVQGGTLDLCFREGNPFWMASGYSWYQQYPLGQVTLPHWLSPYGKCTWKEEKMIMEAEGMPVHDFFVYTMDEGWDMEVNSLLYEKIKRLYEKAAARYLESVSMLPEMEDDTFPLILNSMPLGEYVSSVFGRVYWGEEVYESTWVAGCTVLSGHTGEDLPLYRIVEDWKNDPQTRFGLETVYREDRVLKTDSHQMMGWRQEDVGGAFFDEVEERDKYVLIGRKGMFEVVWQGDGYRLSERSIPVDAFVTTTDPAKLVIRLKTPEGEIIRMSVPWWLALDRLSAFAPATASQ